VRLPPVKLPAEYKTPEVPLLTVHKNAPKIVAEAFITNVTAEEVTREPVPATPGLELPPVAEAVPKATLGREPAYAVLSAHPP